MSVYLTVFGFVLSTAVLPLPEEVALLGAGFLAHRQGLGRLAGCFFAAWLAVMIGDVATLLLGRSLGTLSHWVQRRWSQAQRRWGAELVERHGWRAIFLGRFLVGLRTFVFLAVGAAGFPLTRFVLIDGLAGVVEVGLLVGVGYAFGHVRAHVGTWIDVILGLVVAALLFGPLVVSSLHRAALQKGRK